MKKVICALALGAMFLVIGYGVVLADQAAKPAAVAQAPQAAPAPVATPTDATQLTENERFRERIKVLMADLAAKQVELADMRVYAQHLEAEIEALKKGASTNKK